MEKKIVIIDNYDSFTYNLVHIIEQIQGHKIDVYRNDEISVDECGRYDYIIISPGPGLPNKSGNTMEIIRTYYTSKKIFGVCLGLQATVEVFGGQLKNLSKVYHGIETPMHVIKDSPIYQDIEEEFIAGRYHSWVADTVNFPKELVIDCVDNANEIMGLHHNEYPLYAVQFHPESIMTPDGPSMLRNFLNL